MPSTRSIRCTTLAPTAMRTRSHEPTALGFAPSHGPTGEGPASGFVGRAIVSPAYVARGHRLDLVSAVTGGWSRSIVTGLVGYPFAFRMRRRRWHRYSMSSNRVPRATDTGLLDSASTQVDCSQPSLTSTLQLTPSFYPRITGRLALAPMAGWEADQVGETPSGTRICPRTI